MTIPLPRRPDPGLPEKKGIAPPPHRGVDDNLVGRIRTLPDIVDDILLATAAREYVASRLAMGEAAQSNLELTIRLDAAWEALITAYDDEGH